MISTSRIRIRLSRLARSLSYLLLVYVQLAGQAAAQSYIDEYDVNRHDRFVADRMGTDFVGFNESLGFELDFSGVGRGEFGPGRWVTMISPTHFLSSNHAIASEGDVVFYNGNDLDSPTIRCTIDPDAGSRVGDTDVWLGALLPSETCDTSAISYYPIARPGNYVDREVYMVGKSNRKPGARSTDVRIGRNSVSYLNTGSYFRGEGDHAIYVMDAAEGDLVNDPKQATPELEADELRFSNGDSGGPTFVMTDTGELELFGIHSYLAYDGLPGDDRFLAERWASVDAFLPTERNRIYAAVQRDDPNFEFVRDLNPQPIDQPEDRNVFILSDSRDCNLDGEVNPDDLDCTQWAGSMTSLAAVLAELNAPLGDFDLDGQVGFFDFLTLTNNFSKEGGYRDGDIDLNGTVEFADFLALSSNFGTTLANANTSATDLPTVPEPTPDRLLLVAATFLLFGLRSRNSR